MSAEPDCFDAMLDDLRRRLDEELEAALINGPPGPSGPLVLLTPPPPPPPTLEQLNALINSLKDTPVVARAIVIDPTVPYNHECAGGYLHEDGSWRISPSDFEECRERLRCLTDPEPGLPYAQLGTPVYPLPTWLDRKAWEGTPTTRRSAPATAPSRSVVATRLGWSW